MNTFTCHSCRARLPRPRSQGDCLVFTIEILKIKGGKVPKKTEL